MKIALIAWREFTAAVMNRGFLIGLLMMPVLGALFAVAVPRLVTPRAVHISGDVLLIDTAARLRTDVRQAFDPAAIQERRTRDAKRALARAPRVARSMAGSSNIVQAAMGPSASIRVVDSPDWQGDPLDRGKAWLLADSKETRRLAVVVVHPDVLSGHADNDRTDYELYVPANIDNRVAGVISDGMREAILTARARAQKVNRAEIEALLRVAEPDSVTVSLDHERPTPTGFNIVLPMVLAGLMMFGVMIGGQTLLTSTIEEKSSRVIEVLLSAVSPFQLMAGKIIGQLAVSLLVLLVYLGLGIVILLSFAMLGLLDPVLLLYMGAFFLITYVFFGAVFAAAGAAVNDMKEAQTLMGPVMLVLMGPWFVAFPISRDPESTMAVVLSFVPPVNPFVMMLRLASPTPPPAWQALLSLGIGVVSACAAIWFAAKVFRIGLLMNGKPPNLATLLRWAKAA